MNPNKIPIESLRKIMRDVFAGGGDGGICVTHVGFDDDGRDLYEVHDANTKKTVVCHIEDLP